MSLVFRLKRSVVRSAKSLARVTVKFGVGVVSYLAFDNHVATLRKVEGPSMSPTINPVEYTEKKYQDLDEINVVRELNNNPELVWFWRKFQLQRGDIVLVVDPKNPNCYIVKRLLGLPGDQIVPLGFNETPLDPVTVPEGKVWVESDAGYGYRDSNLFGPVDIASIQGQAQFCINVLRFSVRSLLNSSTPESLSRRLTVNNS